jgi:hypothetical protein
MEPQYVDFHTLIATLAPLFLLAGLVGLYTWGVQEASFSWRLFNYSVGVVIVVLTGIQIVLSLDVLAGFRTSSPGLRDFQTSLLLVQMGLGVLFAIREVVTGRSSK